MEQMRQSAKSRSHSREQTSHSVERMGHSMKYRAHSKEQTSQSVERMGHSEEWTSHSREWMIHSVGKASDFVVRMHHFVSGTAPTRRSI